MSKEKEIVGNSGEQINKFCATISYISENSADAVTLCKQFISFFTLLHSEYKDTTPVDTSDKYPEFLNYWLNNQFRAKNIKIIP